MSLRNEKTAQNGPFFAFFWLFRIALTTACQQKKLQVVGRYQLNGQLIISTDGFERSVDISTDQSIYQLFLKAAKWKPALY